MIKSSVADTSTLERLNPTTLDRDEITGEATYRLHVDRYEFAAQFVQSGRVLDCACGAGYGSAILAEAGTRNQSVTGVDIDAGAVDYAKANYGGDSLQFVCSDGTQFEGGPFDVIVSFETIEHVPDPEALIDNLARLLKAGGIFVASVPVTPSVDVNPFHQHDFTQSSFRRMFEIRGFSEIGSLLQRQPYQPLKIIAGKEARLNDMRQNLVAYYASHPASAMKRIYSTVVDGFCNKYLACAWRR